MGPERGLDTFNHKVLQHLDPQGSGELVQGPQGPRTLPVPCRLCVQGTRVQEVVNRLVNVGQAAPTQETSISWEHESYVGTHDTVMTWGRMRRMGLQGNPCADI